MLVDEGGLEHDGRHSYLGLVSEQFVLLFSRRLTSNAHVDSGTAQRVMEGISRRSVSLLLQLL